jgi:recombination protein RecT
MNTAVATQTQSKQITPFEEVRSQVLSPSFADQVKMALPDHISVEKFQRIVITALAKTPDLVAADRPSLFTSCVEAAADGLLPNGKEAALVVYNTKVKRGGNDVWIKAVQYMPMIAGIYKKARNSGEVKTLAAYVVYENDEFSFSYGFEPTITHNPVLGDRGKPIAVYAVAVMADGCRDLEVMTIDEVEKVRKASRAGENGPWKAWWEEMARKTAVRRLAKRLPLTPDLERVINRMDAMYEFEEGKASRAVAADTRKPALGYDSAGDQMSAFAPEQHPHGETIEGETAVNPETGEIGETPDPVTAARATLAACQTVAELDAAWDALPVNVCREIGAGVYDELRARLDSRLV